MIQQCLLGNPSSLAHAQSTSTIGENNNIYCATDDPTLDEQWHSQATLVAWRKQQQQQVQSTGGGGSSRQQQQQPIHIPVKWHSVARDDGSDTTTNAQILASIAALNIAYAQPDNNNMNIGFVFDFDISQDLTFTQNTLWHTANRDRREDKAMKQALRQGDCRTLNIYSTGSFQGIFGWGTKPFECTDQIDTITEHNINCVSTCTPDLLYDDGVVIRYDVVAGGPLELYREGDVLVHEVGHWLGLYHTFQGHDCSLPGDFIDDTPAERQPARGCEDTFRDTCRGDKDNPPGLDPIHNYMDISNDICMFEFTDGQFEWMRATWDTWRGGNVASPSPSTTPTQNPVQTPQPTNQPTTSLPAVPTSEPTIGLPKRKEAPQAKCGTLAAQSGYGGVAAQAKDCSNRRTRETKRNRDRLRGLKRKSGASEE